MSSTILFVCAASAVSAASALELGSKALEDFRVEDAIELLERARKEGPYKRDDYIHLYERLGIAYAYLGKNDEALRNFDMLLALDPGHALSYTLSPKVTFLFERSRHQASVRAPPNLDLSWPLGLQVGESIPLDIEVLADPLSFLKSAQIFTRMHGWPEYRLRTTTLPALGQHLGLTLAAPDPKAQRAGVLDIYVLGLDERGNQVYTWGGPEQPRQIPLRYQPPDPWYQHWWVWAIGGTVLAVGAGVGVFIASRAPGSSVSGTFKVAP